MVEVNNLTTNKADEKFLIGLAKKVLEGENKKTLELSIALVGQATIRKLNYKYRKKNRATDVLSFQYSDNSAEVVICPSKTEKNGLAKVLIHGILHILDYNHEESVKAAEIMEKKQNYYLKNV